MVGFGDLGRLFQFKGFCGSIKPMVDIVSSCAVRSGLCPRKHGIAPLELGPCLGGRRNWKDGKAPVKSIQEFLTGRSISLPHQGLDGPSSMGMKE